jgi:two-component system, OmpR family, sensor histidine kinase KdpD
MADFERSMGQRNDIKTDDPSASSKRFNRHAVSSVRLAGEVLASVSLADFGPYLVCLGLVVVATLVAESSNSLTAASSLTLMFLVAVVVSARRYGLWPALFTTVLSVLCWDFFFTRPYYSLFMSDPRDVVALVVFLIVSLIVGGMTAQIKRQNEQLASQAQSMSWLYRLSQEISLLPTVDEIASFAASRIAGLLNAEAVVCLRGHDNADYLVFPPQIRLTPEEIAAATVAGSDETKGGRYDFLPLMTLQGHIGSVGLSKPASSISSDERPKLDALLNQVAIAIERAWLEHDIEHARMVAETERLRNALLTSVSHDLRTPLTTIIGALSTLEGTENLVNPSARSRLVSTARDEAERLDRFVGNLLDITRLESGNLKARLTATDIADVVESALRRGRTMLANHAIDVSLPEDLPFASADFALLEQVLFNLLDNAAKYSPPHTTIRIRAFAAANSVAIEVADDGPGVPEQAYERIFEKFGRFAFGDSVPPGTGLGLTICRGFLKSMNGTISVSRGSKGHGAVFTIQLNRAQQQS